MGGVCFNGAIITFIFYAWLSLKAHELFILYFYAPALTREVLLSLEVCCWHVDGLKKKWKTFSSIDILLLLQWFWIFGRLHIGIKLRSWLQDIYTSPFDCTIKGTQSVYIVNSFITVLLYFSYSLTTRLLVPFQLETCIPCWVAWRRMSGATSCGDPLWQESSWK